MKSTQVRFPVIVLAALFSMMAIAGPVSGADDEVKGLFVVVTSPDPETQMMAMVLANRTFAKGKTVQVLLCGPAGDLALKDSESPTFKPIDKSPKMLLQNLLKNGAKVQVCAIYLPNREGAETSDLLEGITPAKPDPVADVLMDSGMKLFTF